MRANYLPLIFALTGFALAQPVYDLILSAPEFLVARQNTNTDTWLLVVFLQVALPLILVPGGIFLGKIHIVAERAYFGLLVFILTAVFLAQLAHDVLATQSMAFFFLVGGMALLLSWAIQITAVQKLAWFLAFLSLGFPILFLFQVPDLDYGEGVSFTEVSKNGSGQPLPPCRGDRTD